MENVDNSENREENKERKKRTPRKPFEELKKTQRSERKRKMESLFKTASEGLPPDVKSVKVDLTLQSGTVLSFYPRKDDPTPEDIYLREEKKAEEMSQRCQEILQIKDKYRISDVAMHELHMICQALPSKNRLLDERERLNSVIPIFGRPNAAENCATRRLADILEYALQLPNFKSRMDATDDITLLLRFAFDGAKITKKINSVRGVFKILHERESLPENLDDLSMSPEEEFTLFFYIGEEDRVTLEKYATDTFTDMRQAFQNGIDVGDKHIKIEWVLTCDWKALTIIKGINSPISDYFCLWCHCRKNQICDFSIPSWPVQRNKEEQRRSLQKREMGYILPDLCPFIPYSSIAIDDLHLRIRISLKLFNQVVTWAIDQKSEKDLLDELKRIGVSFRFWEERGDDKSSTSVKKWSQPSGDDLKLIVKNMRISNVLEGRPDRHFVSVESLSVVQLRSELKDRSLSSKGTKAALVVRLKEAIGEGQKVRKKSSRSRLQVSYDYDEASDDESSALDVDGLQSVWDGFARLMESIQALPTSPLHMEASVFMEAARKWAQDFRRYTFDEDVIPYIHAMVYHVPFCLNKYKYLHDVGVSQVERKNYDHRQAYFGSTNRAGGKWKQNISLQILQRENRMLYCKFEGKERVKRRYVRKEYIPDTAPLRAEPNIPHVNNDD